MPESQRAHSAGCPSPDALMATHSTVAGRTHGYRENQRPRQRDAGWWEKRISPGAISGFRTVGLRDARSAAHLKGGNDSGRPLERWGSRCARS